MNAARLLILSVLSAAATFGAVEGLSRLLALGPPLARFPAEFATERPFVRRDAEVGFGLVPGYTDGRYRINNDGFRGEPFPPDLRERFTVLCAGNSTTFGWRVSEGGHFPALLADIMRGRFGERTWVVNGGVPSFSSAQVLRKLERDLPLIEPEVLVVTMPWNDMWYSAMPSWNPDVLTPQVPHPWQIWLLRRSAFSRALAAPEVGEPEVNRSVPKALDLFAAKISAVIDLVRGSGAALIFQTPPMDEGHVDAGGVRFELTGLKWQRDFLLETARRYVAEFERVAADEGVPVASNPLFLGGGDLHELFVDEIHPTVEGYARTAEALLDTLELERLLPSQVVERP
jgi:lysophospholipase L1-like esterase